MLEVRLRRQPHGCIYWPLTLMSFGLFALVKSLGERHFIRRMDETGVETRAGKRLAWNEFTSIQRVQATMGGGALSDEYLRTSPKGRISLPLWRTENAQEARDYAFRHLPPGLLQNRG